MRDIDANILAELAKQELRPFLLLDLAIGGSHYRYTDCDVPLYIEDDTYEPRGFSFTRIGYSSETIVDSVDISVDNLDQVLTSLFVGGTPQAETVILSLVVLDSSYEIVGATSAIVFQGRIDAWDLDEVTCSITVTSLFSQWSQHTLAKYSASCRWKQFKGAECGYSGGETWCDRTYARCQALGNTDNFGGFRWLPSIVDKEIWWGRVQGAS
jgi:hypothetical protein